MREVMSHKNGPVKFYSDVVKAKGTFLFLAGQVAQHADGSWAEGFEAQTELALANLKKTLDLTGATIDDIVKVSVFMSDTRYGDIFNRIYGRVFTENKPVRTRIQCGLLAPECLIEIDVIAVVDSE